jgi:hypothetical protein
MEDPACTLELLMVRSKGTRVMSEERSVDWLQVVAIVGTAIATVVLAIVLLRLFVVFGP